MRIMGYTVKFAARSDIGRVRVNNEDNLYCNGIIMESSDGRTFSAEGECVIPCMFAVFDGMGGEDCGELASLTAAQSLQRHSEKILNGSSKDVYSFTDDTNSELLALMRKQHIRTGTTLAMITAGNDSFMAYNLGDSRVYRLAGKKLLRVTDDHTMAEDKVKMGLITPSQAEHDRDKNVLTRFLGIYGDEFEAMPETYGPFYFREGRRALICSDGLTNMAEHEELEYALSRGRSVSEIAGGLVDLALKNGGRDNITCIVLEFQEG